MKKLFVLFIILFLISYTLISCSATQFSSQDTPPSLTVDISEIRTKAVQDALASLTASAPTITPTPTDVLYFEDFSSPKDGWPISDDPGSARRYLNGQYLMSAKDDKLLYWNLSDEALSNGVLNVSVQFVSGNKENSFAHIDWRVSLSNQMYNCYDLAFTDTGQFQVMKEIEGKWTNLINVTKTSAFNVSGQPNKVTIAFNDDSSEIYINDQYVGSFTDDSLQKGFIGLGVTLGEGNTTTAEFSFDNLVVYNYDLSNGHVPKKNPNSSTGITTEINPTIRPIINTIQPTVSHPVLDITINVTNQCPEQHTVIFNGPLRLKYVVASGATVQMSGAHGTYAWTVDGIPAAKSPQELFVSGWTLTLCP